MRKKYKINAVILVLILFECLYIFLKLLITPLATVDVLN